MRNAYNQLAEVIMGHVPMNENAVISRDLLRHGDEADELRPGDFVYIKNDSGTAKWARQTLAAPSLTAYEAIYGAINALAVLASYDNEVQMRKDTYMVVAGQRAGEAGSWGGYVTALRGNFVVRTRLYTTGAFVPGSKVSLTSGVPVLRTSSPGMLAKPVIGEVIAYNTDTSTSQADRYAGLEFSVRS